MKVKFNIEGDFNYDTCKSLLTYRFRPNDEFDIQIYAGDKPILCNHTKSIEESMDYIMSVKDKFSNFINDSQPEGNVQFMLPITIIQINEYSLDKNIDKINKSDCTIIDLNILNPRNSEKASVLISKEKAIETLNFLKKIYIESKKTFEDVWASPEKNNYEIDGEGYKTMYINSSLNVNNSTELITTILDIKDDDSYNHIIVECDTYDESSPYLYKTDDDDYSITFKSYNDAIKWILYANIEYDRFKNKIVSEMIDENIDNDISLFLLRYI